MDYLLMIVRICTSLLICSAFVLKVVATPRFVEEPDDVEAIQGQTKILKCTIDGLDGPMQWVRDQFGLGDLKYYNRYRHVGSPELGEYHLMISNIGIQDDATYDCQVIATANYPGLRSKRARVIVLLPPSRPIIEEGLPIEGSERKRVEVVADTPYNLTCTAPNGRPAANVTWYKDGVPAQGETLYTVTRKDKRENASASLNITVSRMEKPTYECQATNNAMRDRVFRQKVEIDVLYAPILSIMVEPTGIAREAQTVTITCSATANPGNPTWRWFLDDEQIPSEEGPTYRLYNVGREHHGKTVKCEATNKVGSTSISHTLDVHYSPRFKEAPVHPAVDLGDDASLLCEVESNPPASILWRRKEDPRQKIVGSDKNLVIEKVAEDHLGVYTCSASVLDFPEIVADVHVLLKGPPHMLSQTDQYARFGSLGRVECKVHSVPSTNIVWSRDGKPLDFARHERYQQQETYFPGGLHGILEIVSVQSSDYGDFNCSVNNGYGSASMVIKLSKQVVSLAYILAGGLVGVIAVIAVAVGAYIYHRRKKAKYGDSSSQESDDSISKKPVPEISAPLQYPPNLIPYVNTWNPDPKYYRNSAEYDELSYPYRDGRRSANPYDMDYPDGYGDYPYERDYRRDYGTYPGPAFSPPRFYDTRYEPGPYGPIPPPDDYGPTYMRAPSRQSYGPLPPSATPPMVPMSPSRLSTNV